MSGPSIHISIAKPCHEQWDGMTATERGAFCQSCQTEVIDFSTMTDREVVEYLSKNKTGCGRFRNDQLNTKLSIPSVENGMFKWRALLLGILSFFSLKNVIAQTTSKAHINQTPLSIKDTSSDKIRDTIALTEIIVVDTHKRDMTTEMVGNISVLRADSIANSNRPLQTLSPDEKFAIIPKRTTSNWFRHTFRIKHKQ